MRILDRLNEQPFKYSFVKPYSLHTLLPLCPPLSFFSSKMLLSLSSSPFDGIPPSMAKHFHEEIELSLQGEVKLFSFRPQWSIFSRL